MLMVDKNKAVLVGRMPELVKEIAFLADKLCVESKKMEGLEYDDVGELIEAAIEILKQERKDGLERSHPLDDINEDTTSSLAKSLGVPGKTTEVEDVLRKAMEKIEKIKRKSDTKRAKKVKADKAGKAGKVSKVSKKEKKGK